MKEILLSLQKSHGVETQEFPVEREDPGQSPPSEQELRPSTKVPVSDPSVPTGQVWLVSKNPSTSETVSLYFGPVGIIGVSPSTVGQWNDPFLGNLHLRIVVIWAVSVSCYRFTVPMIVVGPLPSPQVWWKTEFLDKVFRRNPRFPFGCARLYSGRWGGGVVKNDFKKLYPKMVNY